MPIATRVVTGVEPADLSARQVASEFKRRLHKGAKLRPSGDARDDPECLLAWGYTPRYRVDLFDTTVYLTNVRQNPDVRFFVAYVLQDGRNIYPRIFYKDVSIIWRVASHFASSVEENWIGKGDVTFEMEDGHEVAVSAESTTDLPLEMQTALEALSRRVRRVPRDDLALELVLRCGPDSRIEAYADFTGPRRKARADPANRIHGGEPIATFEQPGDPSSLRFAPGFEPDFEGGVLETSHSSSRLYGGRLARTRILSANREIQYLFFAGPHHAWIIPPQATTTELSSFCVRTIDVAVPDDLCIPGYEYHFMDDSEDPPVLYSQIPKGFAGAESEVEPGRADASAWLDRLPVIEEFRKRVGSLES